MLVLCVGMYRACSTWQYGVAGEILGRHRAVRRLGFLDGGPFADVEPGLDPAAWHVLKAHDAHERFASALADGRALAIYAHRDLRDVAFSWAHKTGAGFEEVVEGGFLGLCLANDRFWRAQPRTLVQSYEALIADPARGVREIAAHLGIELAEGEAQEIAQAHSFEANRKRADDLTGRLRAIGREPSSKDQESYDRDSLLHWNHLRDGRAGGWRDLANAGQRAALARACGPWLIENGYEADDSWARPDPPASSGPPPEQIPRVSYAQNMEDILLDRLFRGVKGTFVDVGANHPTHNNNTYFFYLRGWRGVNVEPVPAARELFQAVRPGDLNLSVAASDVAGELPFFEVPACTGLSSLSPEVAQEQRERGFEVVEHRVPTVTVAGLVDRYRLEPPEVFSIDVEGNEERVLRGIPLDRWRPKVFVIEATRPMTNIPCHHAWEPILLGHGYLFAAFDGINRYYLRDDLAEALPLFDCPVNSLDFYERADVVEQRERADALARLRDEDHARTEEHRLYLERELTHFRQEAAHHAAERVAERAQAIAERARERDAFQVERDAVQAERDAVQRERDASERERDAWQVERDAVQRERDSRQVERDAVQRERDTWQRERDGWHRERESWNAKRDTRLAELEAWQSERFDWGVERAALQTEADRATRRSEEVAAEADRLRQDHDRAQAEARDARHALQEAREALERERGQWHAERADRDRQASEAETLHRPYRLFGRKAGRTG